MKPGKKKVKDFLSKLKVPKTLELIRCFIGFFCTLVLLYQNGEKNLCLFIKKTTLFWPMTTIRKLKNLEQACELSLRLPKAKAQNGILPDSSFHAAGYVLMIKG